MRLTMIHYKTNENILESNAKVLVNPVNCVGVMGKGLALQFKNKFPDYFDYYKEQCKVGRVRIGSVNIYRRNRHIKFGKEFIVSFPTKYHWKEKSKLENLEKSLSALKNFCLGFKIETIAIPKLGCGEGGLDWKDVKPIIENEFKDFENIEVYVYE